MNSKNPFTRFILLLGIATFILLNSSCGKKASPPPPPPSNDERSSHIIHNLKVLFDTETPTEEDNSTGRTHPAFAPIQISASKEIIKDFVNMDDRTKKDAIFDKMLATFSSKQENIGKDFSRLLLFPILFEYRPKDLLEPIQDILDNPQEYPEIHYLMVKNIEDPICDTILFKELARPEKANFSAGKLAYDKLANRGLTSYENIINENFDAITTDSVLYTSLENLLKNYFSLHKYSAQNYRFQAWYKLSGIYFNGIAPQDEAEEIQETECTLRLMAAKALLQRANYQDFATIQQIKKEGTFCRKNFHHQLDQIILIFQTL